MGSNKAQYGLGWSDTATVTFDPPWDISATPIAQFQGGGNTSGLNDFQIIFTDDQDNSYGIVIDTLNSDWSAPVTLTLYDSEFSTKLPTNIARITFKSFNTTNSTVGLIGFYEADNTPVIYETLDVATTRLTAKKAEILNSLS